MTGFGRGVCAKDGREITIELKSVNHRFLDLAFRMPRAFSFLEDTLRRWLQTNFARGHIDVFLTYKNERDDAREAVVDKSVAAAYLQAARELSQMGAPGELSVCDLVRISDVVRVAELEEDQQILQQMLLEALELAGAQMKQVREEEGARLRADILSRLDVIEQKREIIAEREPLVVRDYRDKLRARLDQLLDDAGLDEARLMQEVAVFADRASIAEELTRLLAHIQSIREAMASNAVIGRRLDFIVQELNRETNTIGSKASDMAIVAQVVDIKAEIEKIREQVQNIE